MDDLKRLEAKVHALSIVTERAWANIFATFTDDPIAAVKKAAQESIDAHDELLAQVVEQVGPVASEGQEFMQQILHYEEEFWGSVEKRVRLHQGLSGA